MEMNMDGKLNQQNGLDSDDYSILELQRSAASIPEPGSGPSLGKEQITVPTSPC